VESSNAVSRGILQVVTLPRFSPDSDPGPDFLGLLQRLQRSPSWDGIPADPTQITHGTTVVAIQTLDGVVMSGDRRATSGHLISHRTIEKVFPADQYSGVAIAGAVGPAMEMVRLFQLQIEHYEKVEGRSLSLDGKANQLSQMLRNNLPAALQGLGVVPIFAGFDEKLQKGRLFEFDITGGRYEEKDFAASGSGSLHASTVLKLRHNGKLSTDEGIDLSIEALFHAADEDSATGGPDPVRGIYPVVAVIDSSGFTRIEDSELAARTNTLVEKIAGERS